MSELQEKPPVNLLPPPSLSHSGWRLALQSLWLKFRRFATPMHLAMVGGGVYLILSVAFTVVALDGFIER